MADVEEYDVLVLGSGEAGKYIAWTLAKQGKRTAVIERRYVGGSCPNIACLPSKNVIHSAKVASYFQRSGEFGITKDGWKIDMAGVRDRRMPARANPSRRHRTGFDRNVAHDIPYFAPPRASANEGTSPRPFGATIRSFEIGGPNCHERGRRRGRRYLQNS